MDSLQTKPLIPEWIKKLAEALKTKTFTYTDGGWDYIILENTITTEELAKFLWSEYQRLNPDRKDN